MKEKLKVLMMIILLGNAKLPCKLRRVSTRIVFVFAYNHAITVLQQFPHPKLLEK